ncbi:MAG: MBL fold metallo-hydrolase [Tissierellia bacterium]|nr:MBL fold metallo-hydrolase [Tissierellia bacterium]
MNIFRMMAGIYAANCLLVYDDSSKDSFVVDPGGNFDDIVDNIGKLNLNPRFILLTHGHGDHIGAVNELKSKYNIPVICHEDEKKLLADSSINLSHQMPMKDIEIIPDDTFKDGDIIGNDFPIEVIHTPGHTAGSCCFLLENYLITGDTIFRGSIGRTDLPTSNYDEIVESIKNKILVLDDGLRIFPGHGAETTMAFERDNNPYFIEFAKYI